jgi:capsular polysaccharide biosynthesis protein
MTNAQRAPFRREFRISVVAGALVALLVVAGGAWLALTTSPKWTAESALVVLPGADLNASDSAAYYETLSRGQIVATFAEVADNMRFQQQAEQSLQLSEAQRAGLTTAVSVVPDTSVILVRTTAGSAVVAEQMADATTTVASKYLAGLAKPYRTELVHTAAGSAVSSGSSPTTLLLLSVFVALVAGVAVQQGTYHLLVAMRKSRRRNTNRSTPDDIGGVEQTLIREPTAGAHGS